MYNQHIQKAYPTNTDDIITLQSTSYPLELIESFDTFSNILAQGASFIYLSDPDNEPIGYILSHGIIDNTNPPILNSFDSSSLLIDSIKYRYWFIHDLTVHPHYRSRGIGKQLLNRLIEFLKKEQEHINEIYIISVDERSHRFWKSHGFFECSCNQNILHTYGQENPKYMMKYI